MQINELVAVLEHIDTSIHDTDLLPAYKALATALMALAQGDHAPLGAVQPARERLVALLAQCEPADWTPAQLAIFESYGGRALLGQPVAAQVDAAFVTHFMDPAALHACIDDLRTRTQQLAVTVGELLAGLSPLLGEIAIERAPVLTGDVVDAVDAVAGVPLHALQRAGGAPAQGGVWDTLRARLQLPARRGGTLVSTDGATLATRVVAAAPVILAAAAKALELYRDYHERRAVTPAPAVQPVAQPVQPPGAAPATASYVRYTYRQSVYIFTQDE